jgi:putative aldouronate transport system permease protein
MKYARNPLSKLADALIYVFLALICAVTVYPIVYVLSMSLSGPEAILRQTVWLFPVGFSVGSYQLIVSNAMFWSSYANTLWYTAAGTLINLLITLPAAYALSNTGFFARRFFMIMFTVTMFFSGGMIPLFLQVNRLGLYNTRWAIILPVAVSTWNLIIARTYFKMSIPDGITESAKIDGANDILVLWKIVLPVSKPIIAVLTIFYAVAHWNSWFPASLYLNTAALHPLQLYLRKLLLSNDQVFQGEVTVNMIAYMQQLKYSSIVVATLPILCVYPFMQKYFIQGVMLGSLKE